MSGSSTVPTAPSIGATIDRDAPRSVSNLVLVVTVATLTAVPVVGASAPGGTKLSLLPVVCLAALPFLLKRSVRNRRLLAIMVCAALWAGGQLFSDVVNGLGPRMSLHFIIGLSVLAMTPAFVWFVRGDLRRTQLLICGVFLGLAVQWVVVENQPPTSWQTWRYGLDIAVGLAALSLADLSWDRGHRLPSMLVLAGLVALGLSMDHRHLAGVAALTLILISFPRLSRRGKHSRHPGVISVVAGMVLLLGGLAAGALQAAQSGELGPRSQGQVARYGTNPATFLFNVRPEPVQELFLFSARPLTGWGSLPRLDSTIYDQSWVFLRDVGVVRPELKEAWLDLEVTGVAAHSTAFDALMRVGVAAIPIWVLVWGLALSAGVQAIRQRSSPLLIMWTMLLLWYSLFEPITWHYSVDLASYLTLVVVTLGSAPLRTRR